VAQVLCAGVELAVGKCARAAFAKLHVRGQIKLARAPEVLDIALSLLDRAPAL